MKKLRTYKRYNPTPSEEVPVAIYVRMSTEHQQYSIANQTDEILRYAKKMNMRVIKTYADKGKSGLNIQGRKGLMSLLEHVENKEAEYKAVLVYDVSRWGRFQDADESAYYEYKCKKVGIKIHYCAEQFKNDDSSFSTIVKNLKRAMAGEYSRELSVKVFAGLCRNVRKGFRAGGSAGYGMRRLLVDQKGNPKQILKKGEQKNIVSDRVILVPGPINECRTIDQIFNCFVHEGKSTHEIAISLNRKIDETGRSRPWGHATILNILQNEKYIGNNVYNRKSSKLKNPSVMNPPEEWVRANNVYEPLVSRKIYKKAQKLIKQQRRSMSDDDMLRGLASLYKTKGYLSGNLIDKSQNIPSANAFIVRFRSLYTAYELVGFHHNKRGRSDEELLIKLKNLFKEHGYLSSGLIDQSKDIPNRNIYKLRFGSIKKAYQLVGYIPGELRLPPEVMLDRLKKLLHKHRYLTEKIINNSQMTPNACTYRKAFGSLKVAYRLIDFNPDAFKITNTELIENLRCIYKRHGYVSGPLIDASEFPFNRCIYSNRFGSLPKAYKKIGYKAEKYAIPKNLMILKLKELYTERGRLSWKMIDACENIPCCNTYINRFGSMKNVYELVGFNHIQGKQ